MIIIINHDTNYHDYHLHHGYLRFGHVPITQKSNITVAPPYVAARWRYKILFSDELDEHQIAFIDSIIGKRQIFKTKTL